MLVVELEHRAVGQPVRHRQVLVERDVAPAHGEQRQLGFRPRHHLRPHGQRGPETRGAVKRRRAPVQPVVVSEIAPAAQNRPHPQACRPVTGQLVGDGVEVRASTRGHDDVVGLEERGQPRHGAAQLRQIRPHRGIRIGRVVLNPRRPRNRRRRPAAAAANRPPRAPPRRPRRLPAAGAPAGHPDLDAHVEAPPDSRGIQCGGHQLDPAHRIHPAHQAEVGMGVQLATQPRHPGARRRPRWRAPRRAPRTPGTSAPG